MTRPVAIVFAVGGLFFVAVAVMAIVGNEPKLAGAAALLAVIMLQLAVPELLPGAGSVRPSTQWGFGAVVSLAGGAFAYLEGRPALEWVALLAFGMAAAVRAVMLRKRGTDRY